MSIFGSLVTLIIPCGIHVWYIWLVVEPTHLKNISQTGNLPVNRGENKKYLKPPPRYIYIYLHLVDFYGKCR